MDLPDLDGCIRLLGAVTRQWLKDSEGNPAARAALAAWLDMTPAELQARIVCKPIPASPTESQCLTCGQTLPPNKNGRGRKRKYCSDRCMRRGIP